MSGIFDLMINYLSQHTLAEYILQDTGYVESRSELGNVEKNFYSLDWTEKQKLDIDGLVSAYNDNAQIYALLSYRKGFLDCVKFFKETGVI